MPRYRCARWPFLKIGARVAFVDGVFATDDPELCALIERADGYGVQILKEGAEEVMAEPEAPAPPPAVAAEAPESLERPAEERWVPRVRQGARGSR